MRRNMGRKAALNLSVQAIIIFVLAFAMLGVGLFVTEQLRDIGGEALKETRGIIEVIGEKPTAEKPIVGITRDGLDLPARKEKQTHIGFYNADKTQATDATVTIDDCKSSDGLSFSSRTPRTDEYNGQPPIRVVSSTESVDASTEALFLLVLNNQYLVSGDTYICKLKVYQDFTDPNNTDNVYESETIFVNVIS